MRRLLPLVLGVGLVVAAPASSGVGTGLRGVVRVPRPICVQDDPCDAAAAGIEIAFVRDGRVVKRITSGAEGRYRVVLRPGTYTVTSPDAMPPKGRVAPSPVRVVAGRMRHVDLVVDTGIRAP